MCDEAEENNLDWGAKYPRFRRWDTCSLCEQKYHGVVGCALGWGSWKTYVGRAEADWARRLAMNLLGNGLAGARQDEEALSVREAQLSMMRRIGAPEEDVLVAQINVATTYSALGRDKEALSMRRDVYSGRLKLHGGEHVETLRAANNYASSLFALRRFVEAKALLLKTVPVARRVLGNSDELTFHLRANYARALYTDPDATLDYFREAATTFEEMERTARRVLGSSHPLTTAIDGDLQKARAALRAREDTPSVSAV